MYHILFIHLSVDGHLCCFHVLAIVNSVCNEHWGACIFLNYVFLQVYVCLRVGLLVDLFLVF